ncbi:MAG: hypothetical protein QF415_15955, partial [Candidatus Undinarchaeales archaeon]|nr:hypothetical protein [Candidatus Undinarchaeales archaeon]
SITYDERIQVGLEVERDDVREPVNVSTLIDRQLCPGDTRSVLVPVPFAGGTVTAVRLVRTPPLSEDVVSITEEREQTMSFSHGPLAMAVAAVGPWRIPVAAAALAIIILALRAGTSRRWRTLLWIVVLVVVLASRWRMLTFVPVPHQDAAFNLHEASVVRDTGHYAPVGERLRIEYMTGFHYLMAAVMLLTGTAWAVLIVPALTVPVIVVLVRRLGLPPLTAPLATLLIGTQTSHIIMTTTTIPTTMTLPLAGAAVVMALSGGTPTARTLVLTLLAIAVGLSHSGGFVYLYLALSCTGAWLFFHDRGRMTSIGVALVTGSLICLAVTYFDQMLFRPGFLVGTLVLMGALARAPRRPDTLRWLVYAAGVLLVLTLNIYVGPYWRARSMGGASLGLLAVVALVLMRTTDEPLELPFLLALPHALWSFATVPVIGYAMNIVLRMRMLLPSLLGISLLAACGLAALLTRVPREGRGRRLLLVAILAGLVGAHLDRVLFIGEDEGRLGKLGYWASPSHPPDDLWNIIRFIGSRPEGEMIVYPTADHFHEGLDKHILMRGQVTRVLSHDDVTDLCAREQPPLIVVGRYLAMYTPGDQLLLDAALEASCYRQVYANPTFRAFAGAS